MIPLQNSLCLLTGGIRTGAGLCQAKGAKLLAFGQRLQIFLNLIRSTELFDRIRSQGRMSGYDNARCSANL